MKVFTTKFTLFLILSLVTFSIFSCDSDTPSAAGDATSISFNSFFDSYTPAVEGNTTTYGMRPASPCLVPDKFLTTEALTTKAGIVPGKTVSIINRAGDVLLLSARFKAGIHDIKVTIPTAKVLKAQLRAANFKGIVDKTRLVEELAGKETTAEKVAEVAIEETAVYGEHIHPSYPGSSEAETMKARRYSLIALLLQDNPHALKAFNNIDSRYKVLPGHPYSWEARYPAGKAASTVHSLT